MSKKHVGSIIMGCTMSGVGGKKDGGAAGDSRDSRYFGTNFQQQKAIEASSLIPRKNAEVGPNNLAEFGDDKDPYLSPDDTNMRADLKQWVKLIEKSDAKSVVDLVYGLMLSKNYVEITESIEATQVLMAAYNRLDVLYKQNKNAAGLIESIDNLIEIAFDLELKNLYVNSNRLDVRDGIVDLLYGITENKKHDIKTVQTANPLILELIQIRHDAALRVRKQLKKDTSAAWAPVTYTEIEAAYTAAEKKRIAEIELEINPPRQQLKWVSKFAPIQDTPPVTKTTPVAKTKKPVKPVAQKPFVINETLLGGRTRKPPEKIELDFGSAREWGKRDRGEDKTNLGNTYPSLSDMSASTGSDRNSPSVVDLPTSSDDDEDTSRKKKQKKGTHKKS